MKKSFYHGLAAGALAVIAAIIYNQVYQLVLGTDFSKILNPATLVSANIIGGIIISLGYFMFTKMVKRNTDVWFNAALTIFTFASLIIPISISLPLDITQPELFLGLAVPLHLFPQLFWLTSKPLFKDE
jgi:hypothetical protein